VAASLSSRRSAISKRTYAPSPPSTATRSSLLTAPTVASANGRTIQRSASGSISAVTSVNTSTSPFASAIAHDCAASFPPRCGLRTSRTPRAAYEAAISSVASVEPSEATITSIGPE
jgi:hypothetical protein